MLGQGWSPRKPPCLRNRALSLALARGWQSWLPAKALGTCVSQLGGCRWLLSGSVPTVLVTEAQISSLRGGSLQAPCPALANTAALQGGQPPRWPEC